jgi:inhibitor of cysteine peptidase
VADIKIEPKDFGKPVQLHMGDTIVIELQENPTTGFRWQVSAGSHLVPSGDQFVPAKDAAPGGGGTRILKLGAVAKGNGAVRLQLRREWESSPPQQSFEVPYQVH